MRHSVNEFRFIGKSVGMPIRSKRNGITCVRFRLQNKTGSVEMSSFGEMADAAMALTASEGTLIAVLGSIYEKEDGSPFIVANRLNLLEKAFLEPKARLMDLSFLYEPRRLLKEAKGDRDDSEDEIQSDEDPEFEEQE